MPRYLHELSVSGSGSFPTDMLRYDQCWPLEQQDVVNMDRRSETRQVTVAQITDTKHDKFTVERWRSFGWQMDMIISKKL